MRAEFYRRDAPDELVGQALWSPGGVTVIAEEEGSRAAIARALRATPLAVEDPSLRGPGTLGPTVLQPGTLSWFREVVRARSGEQGFAVRLIADSRGAMGWDPAGAYRRFGEAVERQARLGAATASGEAEAGEARAEGTHGPSEPGTEAAKPVARPSAASPSEPTPG